MEHPYYIGTWIYDFPNSWDDDPIWLSYISGGWNHQPVMVLATIYDPKQLKKLVRMVSNIGHDTWWSMFRRVYSQKMEICVM